MKQKTVLLQTVKRAQGALFSTDGGPRPEQPLAGHAVGVLVCQGCGKYGGTLRLVHDKHPVHGSIYAHAACAGEVSA